MSEKIILQKNKFYLLGDRVVLCTLPAAQCAEIEFENGKRDWFPLSLFERLATVPEVFFWWSRRAQIFDQKASDLRGEASDLEEDAASIQKNLWVLEKENKLTDASAMLEILKP
jgi:hypothetical protein